MVSFYGQRCLSRVAHLLVGEAINVLELVRQEMSRLVSPAVRELAHRACVSPVILRNSLFENSPDLFAGTIVIDVNIAKAPALLEIHTL